MARELEVLRLGAIPYVEGRRTQEEILRRRIEGEGRDTLVLCEHESIVTVGRKTPREDVEGLEVPVVEVERGGEATWHGPGQLVAYPILTLEEGRRDLHAYLRDLEEVVIRCLAEVEIEGLRKPGLTGVWIGDRKVCSVGVAVRRWVTWHGLALNVHNDLGGFEAFKPCGLEPKVMTRVCDHAEVPPTTLLFQVLVVKHLCEVFGYELPPPPPSVFPEGGGECGAGGFPTLPMHPTS